VGRGAARAARTGAATAGRRRRRSPGGWARPAGPGVDPALVDAFLPLAADLHAECFADGGEAAGPGGVAAAPGGAAAA